MSFSSDPRSEVEFFKGKVTTERGGEDKKLGKNIILYYYIIIIILKFYLLERIVLYFISC